MELQQTLADHLQWWGLKRVLSDREYDAWQRRAIPHSDLAELNALAAARTATQTVAADRAFYDCSARPAVLPVLYSQRYDYYMAVGPLIAERIEGAHAVLDYGCGPGILTTFYAQAFPDIRFTGVDRSSRSIQAAREHAERLDLANVDFECVDVIGDRGGASRYDVVVATHALLQADHDPGVPSIGWWTFDRSEAVAVQRDFEHRTGVADRLDALGSGVSPEGRLVLFEKLRQPGRRIPFQRALASRGWRLVEPPLPIRYVAIEEVTDDGPLLVVTRQHHDTALDWGEDPEWVNGDELQGTVGSVADSLLARLPGRAVQEQTKWRDWRYGSLAIETGAWALHFGYVYLKGRSVSALLTGPQDAMARVGPESPSVHALLASPSRPMSETEAAAQPLYENHTPWAQLVWSGLPDRQVTKEATRDGPGGRQWHVELGTSSGIPYVYCANTFDQRQLIVVEPERVDLLTQYYDTILDGDAPSGGAS